MAEVRHSRTETAHIEVNLDGDVVDLMITKQIDTDGYALFRIDVSEFESKEPLFDVTELRALHTVIGQMLEGEEE